MTENENEREMKLALCKVATPTNRTETFPADILQEQLQRQLSQLQILSLFLTQEESKLTYPLVFSFGPGNVTATSI